MSDRSFQRRYLYNTIVRDMRFANMEMTDFYFYNAEFEGVTFENVNFTWTKYFPSRVTFRGCKFVNVTFDRAFFAHSQFRRCQFFNFDFQAFTFSYPRFYDTIFCDNYWENARFSYGEMYNTTFIKNTFKNHYWGMTRFTSYYYGVVACKDIPFGMTVYDFSGSGKDCQAYGYFPGNSMSQSCNYFDKRDRSRCYFHASVRFWDCTFQQARFSEVQMRAVEFYATRFERCTFERSTFNESYFISSFWTGNTFEGMFFSNFVTFTGNYFTSNVFRFKYSMYTYFYGCEFYSNEMYYEYGHTVHFQYCYGENNKFYGNYEYFRIIYSTFSYMHFEDMVADSMDYCYGFMREWTVFDSEVKATRDICSTRYGFEYFPNSWYKGSPSVPYVYRGDFFSFCKKEFNYYLPVCYGFTHFTYLPCCAKGSVTYYSYKAQSRFWWSYYDFTCPAEQGSYYRYSGYRKQADYDVGYYYQSFDHYVPDFRYFHCFYGYMKGERYPDSFYVYGFESRDSTLKPYDFFAGFTTPYYQYSVKGGRTRFYYEDRRSYFDKMAQQFYRSYYCFNEGYYSYYY